MQEVSNKISKIVKNLFGLEENAELTIPDEKFGDFESFKAKFKDASVGRFGSGWGWLVLNSDNSIDIVSTPNQDNPISEGKKVIFGLDVWEHAYYLKYTNKRPDYIDAWWNVVNWSIIEERYQSLK